MGIGSDGDKRGIRRDGGDAGVTAVLFPYLMVGGLLDESNCTEESFCGG